MTEHTHEWTWTGHGFYCKANFPCTAYLSVYDAEAMLNAAELLSAEVALEIVEDYELAHPKHLGYARDKQTDALRAYAKARGDALKEGG